jgi:hypothetical protein
MSPGPVNRNLFSPHPLTSGFAGRKFSGVEDDMTQPSTPYTAHVTRVAPAGEVYGHETDHCDAAGCAADELSLGVVEGAEVGHVYEIHANTIVAEIV